MVIKSSLLTVQGIAAPVNPAISHRHRQLLPRRHPMNIGLPPWKTLKYLKALTFSSMKMSDPQFRAYVMRRWVSSRLPVNDNWLLISQVQSWSPEWKGQRRSSRIRMLHLLALLMALQLVRILKDMATLCRSKQILQEVRRKKVKLVWCHCRLMRQNQLVGLPRPCCKPPWSQYQLNNCQLQLL